ncbi:MAG: hypothetical protein KAI59_04000 [Planctomycetes bacterium]|nr:hypothetical protein [Planctomycetota bacterium]MCK5473170.1 hypothetical protein [Planctomycetota bacterium]
MAIVFHCEYCDKKIEAPDTAGGKWGKCPSCHNKLYVPNLAANADDEELKIAPINDSEEAKERKLMAETYQLTQKILEEKETPEGRQTQTAKPAESAPTLSDKQLTEKIISCLRLMADGQLDRADIAIDTLANQIEQAGKILDNIALSEIPEPQLDDIPPQVLAGLIRTMRAKMS